MARRKESSSPERYRDDFSEREFEERVEARRRRSGPSSDPRKASERAEKEKAPILLRVLAWCGVILLCFVAGYVGTSYMLHMLDTQSLLKPEGRVQNQEELRALLGSETPAESPSRSELPRTKLALFYPKGENLAEERAEILPGTQEENIQDAIRKLLTLSGFPEGEIRLLHVFRNVDTVFLDFSGAFIPALSAVGVKPSTLFITGVVRTLRDNFPPIKKVRFMVDSQITTAGAPVDLTATWQLPQ
ncbi:MAG: GerMN domain-containing protein [Synergistaceae bacterium]|jgi:hypothetical protein|nr:GerMN domain-containing protein [Synergistaceae bacterium]